MPVLKLYRVQCGECRTTIEQLWSSHQDAIADAIEKGWQAYPILCPPCRRKAVKK
jgi:hypothetical protein